MRRLPGIRRSPVAPVRGRAGGSRVTDALARIGLEAPASTKMAERRAEQDRARVDIARALARASRLEARAAREPLNSNGRRKHEAHAAALRAEASRLAAAQGVELAA